MVNYNAETVNVFLTGDGFSKYERELMDIGFLSYDTAQEAIEKKLDEYTKFYHWNVRTVLNNNLSFYNMSDEGK